MFIKVMFPLFIIFHTLPVLANQPNIVFILADDLGAHTLSSDGNPIMETPHLDKLAAAGMSFSRGYANAATCKPSRAAIISGQYAPRTEIYRVVDRHKGKDDYIKFKVPPNATHLALDNITLAESLKAAGYQTGHFGKWHLEKYKSYLPDTQGFDVSYESHKVHFGAQINMDKNLPNDVYIGDFMTDKALEFIDNATNNKKPFFAYIPYYLIHKPWQAKADDLAYFDKKWGNKYDATTKSVAAMTKALDDNVGRVNEHLEKLGISDNTLVVFTSDNGGYKMPGNVLNGKLRGYKGEIYEGGLRVPYIFKFPTVIANNQRSNEMIMGIDIYPTLISFAKAKAPQQALDGVDFMPLLTGNTKVNPPRSLFWFFPKWERYQEKTGKWYNSWRNVINNGRYKLIEYPDLDQVEVYDLENDPFEQQDISSSAAELTTHLQQELKDWKINISAHQEIINPNFKETTSNK
ncbi:sulfatase [Thalassotalea psychrophila]|uniref:Sulfatase n=1 Tax=Thalassotalea psychrophila TaxID=3065647 RepID=A0ABY9TXK0_9GAMM|nr:sulfatase [Colwelliaceae bacterium SQ149]